MQGQYNVWLVLDNKHTTHQNQSPLVFVWRQDVLPQNLTNYTNKI